MRGSGIIAIVYLVIGVLVAAARDYFERLGSVQGILSLLLAIVLWPLILFGVDIRIGKDGDGGRKDILLPLGLMWSMTTARGRALLDAVGRGRAA
ncbi:MAG: hypothetical protein ACRDJV_08515 [Actinomycetota bacterium]